MSQSPGPTLMVATLAGVPLTSPVAAPSNTLVDCTSPTLPDTALSLDPVPSSWPPWPLELPGRSAFGAPVAVAREPGPSNCHLTPATTAPLRLMLPKLALEGPETRTNALENVPPAVGAKSTALPTKVPPRLTTT